MGVVERDANDGFGAACNVGIANLGDVDAVALVNNDARVEPGWLTPLADAGCGAEGRGRVPKILLADRYLEVTLHSSTARDVGDGRERGVLVSGARVDDQDVWTRSRLRSGFLDARRTNPSPVPSGQVQTRRSWCRRASAWSSRWRRPRTRRRSPSASVVHSRRSTSGRHVVGTRSRAWAQPWTSSTTQERRSTSRASDRTAVTSNLRPARRRAGRACVVARSPVPRRTSRKRLFSTTSPCGGRNTAGAIGMPRSCTTWELSDTDGSSMRTARRRPGDHRLVCSRCHSHRAPHSQTARLSAFGSFVRLLRTLSRAVSTTRLSRGVDGSRSVTIGAS